MATRLKSAVGQQKSLGTSIASRLLFGPIILFGFGLIAFMATSYPTDHANAQQFAAARNCTGPDLTGPTSATAATSTDNDCLSWQQITVIGVSVDKDVTHLTLQGVPEMDFSSAPNAITRLTAGDQVQVLFWRGNAEGAAAAGGQLAYTNSSAAARPEEEIGYAFFGLFLVLLGAPMPVDWWAVRRAARTGEYPKKARIAIPWLFGLAFADLAAAVGILTDGLVGALVGLAVIGGLVLLFVGLIAYGRIQGRRRYAN